MYELFPWNPLMETGIAEVDAQHRVLVGMLNRLADQHVHGANEQDVTTVLAELANYADYHFRTEEAVWQADLAGDTWLEEHARIHQKFFAHIAKLREGGRDFKTVIDELFDYLTRWLIGHILGDDKRMALAVLAVRGGMTPEAAHQHALAKVSHSVPVLVEAVLSMYQSAANQALALAQEKHAREKAETSLQHTENRWRFLLANASAAQEAGSPLEQTLRTIIDHVPAGLVAADAFDEHFVFANPWFCNMLGYSLDELLTLSPKDLHPADKLHAVKADFDFMEVGTTKDALVIPVRRKDGSIFMANIERVPVSLYGQTSVLAVFTDVTERYYARRMLEAERLRLQTAIDAAQAGTWEWDIANDTVRLNERASTMLGQDPSDFRKVAGAVYVSWIHPEDLSRHQEAVIAHLRGQQPKFECELRLRHQDGHWVWFRTLGRVMERDKSGRALRVSGIGIDVSEQKSHQAHIDYITHHDALTGLPNRKSFVDVLARAMGDNRANKHLAVAYIDLDGFAAINQSYGESVGNALILEISRRLRAATLEQQYMAHIGGDEFAFIFYGLDKPDDHIALTQHLLQAVAQPVQLEPAEMTVTASIGITLFPQGDRVDAEQLLRQADQAMYSAKQSGKNRYYVFDATLDESTRERMLRLDAIRQALERREFVLFYQPKTQLASGRVTGFEALIRWQHPQRGLLPPIEFIPLLDGQPLAIAVGNWVIETALAQLATWNAQGLTTQVSVNIDAMQLLDAAFSDRLQCQMQAQPSVQASQFQIEILETGALGNMAHVSAVIARLQAMGVECALDDFGTGYSSLTFLKQLAAHTIKIDQSFVRGMLDDAEHAAIVNSVLSLARNFDRKALAEGVETEAHGRSLIEFGCEFGQGYAIARPMPAAHVPDWLANWKLPQRWAESSIAPPRDIPILLAKVEHRAWIKQLRSYLANPSLPAPGNNEKTCRFGKWLNRPSTFKRFDHRAELTDLREIHRNLHQQAAPLLVKVHANPAADVRDDLDMLEALSQTMLSQLRTLRLSSADTGWASSDFGEL
ncbi:MAG: bacteriohemerythrin [Rhodoferax sp.]|nr:bacteriohemerythrin [Rhodoferax sp.]